MTLTHKTLDDLTALLKQTDEGCHCRTSTGTCIECSAVGALFLSYGEELVIAARIGLVTLNIAPPEENAMTPTTPTEEGPNAPDPQSKVEEGGERHG